ncbi:MAG: RHS repeat protein, partial [Clostridia bacterium]|nr:RHS repeat protein [Clostridia bacterium]
MKAENKIQPEGILEQDVELFSHKDISEDNILFEDVKKRDERTKHFRTKDGKYIAATFRNPIHVLDESTGEYVDIADTFEEKEDCFESKNPRYNARFPKEDSEASFVSIEKNGRSVDWHFRFKNSAKKKASVKKKEKHSKLECDAFPTVRYEGNSDDCVLEYKLTESGIKEDIILFSRPEKSEFEFDFKIKGLDAILDDDKKTIKLFANDTESVEPEFVLPKIVMFDAAGVYSEDAHYEIEEHGNKLTVKVIASDEWLLSDERVYPVTIDPQVNTTDDSALVRSYANVFSNGTTYTGSSSFRVGIDENQLESLLCCKTTFPSLPQGAKIISATLNLKNTSYRGMAKYEVFPITESWETSSVKWSNMPKVDYNSPCGTFVSAAEDILRVDITAEAKKYYRNNSTLKGLLIKHNCSCIDEDEKCPFDSAQYITISATEINHIAVEYMLMDEYADHQAQKSFEVGRAGVGSVNIFTGKLHFVHNDINESGGHLPLSLSHIYNSAYNEIGENDVTYGKGWHLSAAQTFAYDMHNNQYIYVDANGRKHYLKPSGATANASHVIFSDTAGLGLTYVDGEGTVKDEKGNKLNFIGEKLYSISDAYNHKITYEYTGDLVTKITDSVGRTAKLTYDSYSKLIRITDDKKRNTTFNYTDNYLASIVYPDGSTTVFEYSNSVLTKVTDYTGTGYEISYDGNENDMRVSSVSQFGSLKISHNSTSAKNIIGGGANFEYYAFSSAVEDNVTKIKTVYRFDTCGRPLFSYEDLTDSNINISDITVTNIKDYDVKHDKYNQPTTGKYLSVNAAITGIDAKYPNLLANNSFDSNAVGTLKPSNWSIGSHRANYDGVVAEGYITEEKTHKAYKFNNKCSYSNKTLTQTIELAETALDGNMLIVSAWAKANKPVNNSADSSTAKFELNAILSYDEHENLEKTVKFDYLCTDWQYVAIPMEIPSGKGYAPTKIQVKFDFSGNSGTCLLSNVRVTPVRGMYTNISYGTRTFDGVEYKRKVVQYDGLNSTQTYYDEKSDLVRKQEYFTSDSGALNSFVTSYEYDLKHRITKSKDYRNIVTENTYDNNGNLIKQKVYNSADNSVYMVTEA